MARLFEAQPAPNWCSFKASRPSRVLGESRLCPAQIGGWHGRGANCMQKFRRCFREDAQFPGLHPVHFFRASGYHGASGSWALLKLHVLDSRVGEA